jgi:hypothetical protein
MYMTEVLKESFEVEKQRLLGEIQEIIGDQLQEFSSLSALQRDGRELFEGRFGGIPRVESHEGELLLLCAGLLSRATKVRINAMRSLQAVP